MCAYVTLRSRDIRIKRRQLYPCTLKTHELKKKPRAIVDAHTSHKLITRIQLQDVCRYQ
nr:MAG TPA: hypothetical protein [Caudoviricetes sp.]